MLFNITKTSGQSIANYAVARTTSVTFNPINAVGTPCNTWRYNGAFQQDDNRSFPIDIGFDFWYNGIRYTELSVSTNGYIDFSTSAANGGPTGNPYGYVNTQFSTVAGTLNAIAPFYDDQTTQGGNDPLGNSIRTQLTGVAPNRVLTIEWFNMAVYLNTTPNLNYQLRLFETTGIIEFHYGSMTQGTANFTYTSGINAATLSFPPTATQLKCQQTANSATFNNTAQNNLTTLPVANSQIRFSSPTPANPSGAINFSGVQTTQMTLGWPNWATNEVGYVIYSSTDGINWEFELQTAANTTTATITGLYSNTSYQWRIFAVTEGWLSAALTGTQPTLSQGPFISAQSGNWNTNNTWQGNTIPGPGDDVIIADGHTVTINTVTAQCHNLQIGQNAVATLQMGNNGTPRALNVTGNVSIRTACVFRVNTASNITHTMNIRGNVSNAGTLDMQPDADSFCNITFVHPTANQSISGSGVYRFNRVIVDKGSSTSRILDFVMPTFTAPAGFLTLINGTFRIATTGSVNCTIFNANADIPVHARLWINSASATVNTTGGSISLYGELRMQQGVLNVGNNIDQNISSRGGFLVLTGGTINVAGRFDRPANITTSVTRFGIYGGTLVLAAVGSSSTTLAPFTMDIPGSNFVQSGGTIIIRREGGTGAQNLG
ncbi:MAG: hypothetical protein ACRCYO_17325, partial [Bacteroidia bacterium]